MFNFKLDLCSLKRIREFIKYSILVGDLAMTNHCLLLLLGISVPIEEFIFGLSFMGYITLFLATYILQFCNNMRMLLSHAFLVETCIHWERAIGFGIMLKPLRLFMVIVGFLLLTKTIIDSYLEGKKQKNGNS